jgi:hypothetical protein
VLKRLEAAGVKLTWLLRVAITQGVLLLCAALFFFPPLEDHGSTLAPRVAQAVVGAFTAAAGQVQQLLAA